MDAAWIDEIAELWKFDEDIDFRALETKYRLRPLDKCGREPAVDGQPEPQQDQLLVCLTGFGDERDLIAERITASGALYTGDLTRKCTHLIVSAPEGKKFTAAKAWGVCTVTLAWLDQSIERGMILDETKFDPLLPADEQGLDAWVKKDPRRRSSGKRSRSSGSATAEEGGRKLRKTASMKLNSQRQTLWDSILERSDSKEYSFSEGKPADDEAARQQKPAPAPTPGPVLALAPTPQQDGIFANCIFYMHGFRSQQAQILNQTLTSLDGTVVSTLEEAALSQTADPSWRFLIVPQTSQPDTHPQSPHSNLHIVTEFYIERCLQNKQFFHPDDHVLGRPFPSFPIPGFSSLSICSSAFTGLELNQVARSIKQLGGSFEEQFRKDTSVLVCRSLAAMRKDKLRYALEWKVPVVSADWLWECISTGFHVPVEDFIFPQLRAHYKANGGLVKTQPANREAEAERDKSKSARKGDGASRPPGGAGMDTTAFDRDTPPPEKTRSNKPARGARLEESATLADFTTARTHPTEPPTAAAATRRQASTPLSELSSASVNKSPSPRKPAAAVLPRHKSDPTGSSSSSENVEPRTDRAPSAPPVQSIAQPRQEHAKDGSWSYSEDAKPRNVQDEARQAARAAERERLTSKITNLLDKTRGQLPGTDFDIVAAAAAAGTAPGGHASRPRKRQILGRAISNVSNASSTGSGPAPESLRSAASVIIGGEQEEEDGREPPGTQLEYRDPEAQKRKAQLMSRMMEEEETR